jgi:tetratricopeptide (TPR) repeat protein
MDPLTLELFRCLQSEPYDESGLQRIRSLLSKQRRALAAQRDLAMLGEIVHLLEDWAMSAADPRVGVRALQDAASIAERELKDPALAARLRATGRTAIAAASGREAISAARAAKAAPGARDANPALQARVAKPASVEPQASGAAGHVAQARKCQAAGDIDGAIEAYEQALNAEAELATVRQLADLFAQRAGAGDAQQAADLYCTLGELLGKPEGVAMLERALAQCPEHTAAKALLATYTGAPKPAQRRPLLDSPSALAAVQAKVQAPPLVLVRREAIQQPPPLAAATFALPSGAPLAPVSSLTPVVRQDVAEEVLPEQRRSSLRRWLAIGGLLTAGSAAAAAFVVSQGRFDASSSMTSLAATAHGATPTENAAPATPVLPPSTPVVPSAAAASGASVPTAAPAAPVIEAPAATASSASADKTAAAPGSDSNTVAPTPTAAPTDDTNAKPAAKSSVVALFDLAKLSGGKLNPAQLSAALDKTTPKLEGCYAQLLKKKPRAKGRLTFQWTLRLNGRIASLKKLNDTINDMALTQCTQQAILDTRFPKPRKQAAQVKLPFEYRRTPPPSG